VPAIAALAQEFGRYMRGLGDLTELRLNFAKVFRAAPEAAIRMRNSRRFEVIVETQRIRAATSDE